MKKFILLILVICTSSFTLNAQTTDNFKIHYSSNVKYAIPNSLFYADNYSLGDAPPVYARNIGLIKTHKKSQFGLGISLGGSRGGREGFGHWIPDDDDIERGYTATGAQLKGFWAEYAYSVLDNKWGLFQPYYRYEYEKLTKQDFYFIDLTDHYYVSDSRTQFRNGLGISWTSNTLWNKIQFNLKYGMDYIREFTSHRGIRDDFDFYETTLTKEENFFDSHVYLGINYVLYNKEKEPNLDSKLKKGIRIQSNIALQNISSQLTLSKGTTTFGVGAFVIIPRYNERDDINSSFGGKGINFFVQENFKTDKKIKPFIELQFSHIISYPKYETPEYYKHEYYDFLYTTSFGIKRSILKKAFIECSLDHVFLHQTPYEMESVNKMGWSLSMAIGYQL